MTAENQTRKNESREEIEITADPSEGDGVTPQESPEGEPENELDENLNQLEKDRDLYKKKLQLTHAEFDNFRRRTREERLQDRQRFTAEVFLKILPIYDDLRKALESGEADAPDESLRKGLEIIAGKFSQVLEEYRIEVIEEVGVAFDPDWHEAVFQEEHEEIPPGHVTEIFECGYRAEGILLRPARVKVAKLPEGETSQGGGEEEWQED